MSPQNYKGREVQVIRTKQKYKKYVCTMYNQDQHICIIDTVQYLLDPT